MKIVVTGGTGFVGREVVRQLLNAGHQVRCIARGGRPVQDGVDFVRGSVLEFATLPSVFAGAEAVIHLVGIIGEVGDQTFERVHTSGTANAVHAARAAGIRRFVHMSALGTRPNAVARYHRSKWEAEERLRRSELRWTIFRPSLIYGPGDDFVNRFVRMARWSPVLPVLGPGDRRLQPVAVEAVAHAFMQSLTVPESEGQIFDLCGPRSYTFPELLDRIMEAAGLRRRQIHLPLPLARLGARVLETVFPAVLGRPAPLNGDQIQMLQEDNVGDPGPAERMLGMPVIGFEDGLRRFVPVRGRIPGSGTGLEPVQKARPMGETPGVESNSR
jgi:NADH dehydrogenase